MPGKLAPVRYMCAATPKTLRGARDGGKHWKSGKSWNLEGERVEAIPSSGRSGVMDGDKVPVAREELELDETSAVIASSKMHSRITFGHNTPTSQTYRTGQDRTDNGPTA